MTGVFLFMMFIGAIIGGSMGLYVGYFLGYDAAEKYERARREVQEEK